METKSNKSGKNTIIVGLVVTALSLIIITVLGNVIGGMVISGAGGSKTTTFSISDIEEEMKSQGCIFDDEGEFVSCPEDFTPDENAGSKTEEGIIGGVVNEKSN